MIQSPKEKADELIAKFSAVGLQRRNEGVQCALIHVNEIIANGGTKFVIEYLPNCYTNGVEYWQQVKQEIEKQQ